MDQITLSQHSYINTPNPYQVKQSERVAPRQVKVSDEKSGKGDTVHISEVGKNLSDENQKNKQNGIQELTEVELDEVRQLKERDREVRAHEQAHLHAAGPHALGGAKFKTTQGPDGNSYATSGHVSVDMSKESTPEATLAKMRIVRQAALAPGSPSSTDRQVAAQASMIEQQAQKEINQQNLTEPVAKPVNVSNDNNDESIKAQNAPNSSKNDSSGFTAQLKQNNSNTGINSSISVFA